MLLQRGFVDVVAAAGQLQREAEHRQPPPSPPKAMAWMRTPFVARQFGRLERIEHAGGVDAVGQQDQHALLGAGCVAQALDRQADGIADRGLAPGQADHAVVELLAHRSPGRASSASAHRRVRPNTIRPTRSPARRSRKSASTALAAVRRSTRPPPSCMSSSLMLPDRSTASIRSRPACGGVHRFAELLRPRGGDAQQRPRQPSQHAGTAAAHAHGRAARRSRPGARRRALSMRRGVARAAAATSARATATATPAAATARRSCPARRPGCRASTRSSSRHPVEEARARELAQAVDLRSASTLARKPPSSSSRRRRRRTSALSIRDRGNASQASPCSLSASGSIRRAARRSNSDIAATFAAGVPARAIAASNSAAIARWRWRRRAMPTTLATAIASSTIAATSHQPGAGGHHDGAGGWWMSRSEQRDRLHHATIARAGRAAAARIRWAHRWTAPARARRAPAAAPARLRSARRIRCASAGVARRWPGRVRRGARPTGMAAPPAAGRVRADR